MIPDGCRARACSVCSPPSRSPGKEDIACARSATVHTAQGHSSEVRSLGQSDRANQARSPKVPLIVPRCLSCGTGSRDRYVRAYKQSASLRSAAAGRDATTIWDVGASASAGLAGQANAEIRHATGALHRRRQCDRRVLRLPRRRSHSADQSGRHHGEPGRGKSGTNTNGAPEGGIPRRAMAGGLVQCLENSPPGMAGHAVSRVNKLSNGHGTSPQPSERRSVQGADGPTSSDR